MTLVFQCPKDYATLAERIYHRDWSLDRTAPCGHAYGSYREINLERTSTATLFTVGYSGKTPQLFLGLLMARQIRFVVDIRRRAQSQHKPDFSKSRLMALLQPNGIPYWHCPALGSEKGLRDRLKATGDYATFFAAYRAALETRQENLRVVAALLAEYQAVALLCTEARAEECHRSVVAEAVFTLLGGAPGVCHL